MMNKKTGFTLIELMIAVAIVAILASVAVPSYMQHVQTARREEAKRALLELAQHMESFYAVNMTYTGSASGGVPIGYSNKVPQDGTERIYTLTISNATANSYELRATPDSNTSQMSDPCGVLSINRLGVTSSAQNSCW